MKRWNLFLIVVLILAMSATIVAPAGACTVGCTPGYWKQEHHFDSWRVYGQDALFCAVFERGPCITLLNALSARRRDYPGYPGPYAAFLRHSVAALLNSTADFVLPDEFNPPENIIANVQMAYDSGRFRFVKNMFEEWNELGCPLN